MTQTAFPYQKCAIPRGQQVHGRKTSMLVVFKTSEMTESVSGFVSIGNAWKNAARDSSVGLQSNTGEPSHSRRTPLLSSNKHLCDEAHTIFEILDTVLSLCEERGCPADRYFGCYSYGVKNFRCLIFLFFSKSLPYEENWIAYWFARFFSSMDLRRHFSLNQDREVDTMHGLLRTTSL